MVLPEYRKLTGQEIEQLARQGCLAEDWSRLDVSGTFQAERIRGCCFSGVVRIGPQNKKVSLFGGVSEPCGIYNSRVHNCVIGADVYINNVANRLANYVIEDDAVIDNVDLLAVDGSSTFGNGTEAAVINEAGGREVPIYDKLSAQAAYLMAVYRGHTKVVENLYRMVEEYALSVKSDMGVIGRGSRIVNCRILKNVRIGPGAIIEGAGRLENGSVNSCPEDPAYVGSDVIAEDFIICSGARVTDGTIIKKCFVGQGTELGRQYSAENSIYFANCAGFHGEACSVFAGPFTVTHHKSTLLIAGLYSFLNAGSGSNQSNHMYKLGPVHQGIVERGSKTTSDSYLLWPARIGAFTLVMGRHYGNCDTSDLPYSYLIEHEDESVLVPAVNLRSVGTVRDARKWPKRDKRKGPEKLDLLIYNLLTPYTVQKMLNGISLLTELRDNSGENTKFYYYNSVKIKRSSLESGIKLYQTGVERYLGNCLVHKLRERPIENMDELRRRFIIADTTGCGSWVDIAGLIAPEAVISQLLNDIENGHVGTLEQLRHRFGDIYDKFSQYEWAWAGGMIQKYHNVSLAEITSGDIIKLVTNWISVVTELDEMRLGEARKEYAQACRVGFGLDSQGRTRDDDFIAVRGRKEDDSFILELQERLTGKQRTAAELIGQLEKL